MSESHALCTNCGSDKLCKLFDAPAFDSGIDKTSARFDVARCMQCSLVQTVGVGDAELAASYNDEYYGAAHDKFIPAVEWVIAGLARATAGRLSRQWGRGNERLLPAVLDIGCGRGVLLKAFASLGAEVLGLERDEFPRDNAMPGFFEAGSLSDARYDDRRFDVVVLWHVFEHMGEPDQLLEEIARHMRPDGMLVVSVPNFSSLQRCLFGRYWFHLDLPRHLVHLESAWLNKALRRHGFQLESTHSFDLLQSVYGFIQSGLNACAPGYLNELYYLLKRPQAIRRRRGLRTLGWLVIAGLLFPLALLELGVGLLLGRASTIEISARYGRIDD